MSHVLVYLVLTVQLFIVVFLSSISTILRDVLRPSLFAGMSSSNVRESSGSTSHSVEGSRDSRDLLRLKSGPFTANELREKLCARLSSFKPAVKCQLNKDNVHLVRNVEEWDKVVKDHLKAEINHFRVFSVDTESNITFGEPVEKVKRYNSLTQLNHEVKPIRYLLIGTCFPRAVVLEIKGFQNEFPRDLLHWLYDCEIIKVGSDLERDLAEDFEGIVVRSWVDSRAAIQIFKKRGWFQRHPDEKAKGRTGIATIFYSLFGWSFKPFFSAKEYVNHYNKQPPEHIFGKHYPKELSPTILYKWKKSNSAFSVAYMRNDAIGVLLLGFHAAIKFLETEGKDLRVSEGRLLTKVWKIAREVSFSEINNTFEDLPGPSSQNKERSLAEKRMAEYWTDLCKSRERRKERERQREDERLKRKHKIQECSVVVMKLVSEQKSSMSTSKKPQAEEEEVIKIHPTTEDMSMEIDEAPSCSKQFKIPKLADSGHHTLSKSGAGRRKTRNIELVDEDLGSLVRHRDMAWHEPQPKFQSCCQKCGQFDHSKPGCPFMKDEEGNPLRCLYPFCTSPETHRTPVCPTLNGRCTICKFRGHNAEQCDDRSLRRFLIVFKRFQKTGFWTHLGTKNIGWDFHPVCPLVQGELLHVLSQKCQSLGKRSVGKIAEVMFERLLQAMDELGTPENTKEEIKIRSQKVTFDILQRVKSEALSDGRDRVQEARLKESATIANRMEVKAANGDEEKLAEAANKLTMANIEAEMFFIN